MNATYRAANGSVVWWAGFLVAVTLLATAGVAVTTTEEQLWRWGLASSVSFGMILVGMYWTRVVLVRSEADRERIAGRRRSLAEAERARAAVEWARERDLAAAEYRSAVERAEGIALRATRLLPPAADPDEVTERLSDLAVDVSTEIQPDGAVVVTLRRKTETAGTVP